MCHGEIRRNVIFTLLWVGASAQESFRLAVWVQGLDILAKRRDLDPRTSSLHKRVVHHFSASQEFFPLASCWCVVVNQVFIFDRAQMIK